MIKKFRTMGSHSFSITVIRKLFNVHFKIDMEIFPLQLVCSFFRVVLFLEYLPIKSFMKGGVSILPSPVIFNPLFCFVFFSVNNIKDL